MEMKRSFRIPLAMPRSRLGATCALALALAGAPFLLRAETRFISAQASSGSKTPTAKAPSTETAGTETPFLKSELLFPVEFWHNHASSIVETPEGDLLVCWFHGSGERQADDVLVLGAR